MNQEDEVRVLLQGEFSSMASCWTEYLCLQRRGQQVVLSTCSYEVLAPLSDFEILDEDGDVVDHQVPDEIDGQTVEGIEDGEYVVGGALVPHDDDAVITLELGEIEEAREWLEGREWHRKPGFEAAWQEICRALSEEVQ